MRRHADGETGLAVGLLAALESLPRRAPIGGRTWIGLVAFALIGIVTLQLGLLKLNAGIGRALEHEALLQRENAALSIENSELAASGRVTSQAATLGMELVPTGALRFLQARPRLDVGLGAAELSRPGHAPGTGSGEAPAGGASASTTLPGSTEQPATGSATTSPSSESSNAGSVATPSSAASASGESPARAPAEAARPSTESTSRPASTPPSVSEPPGGSGAAGGAAGGTQAGPG